VCPKMGGSSLQPLERFLFIFLVKNQKNLLLQSIFKYESFDLSSKLLSVLTILLTFLVEIYENVKIILGLWRRQTWNHLGKKMMAFCKCLLMKLCLDFWIKAKIKKSVKTRMIMKKSFNS